MHLSARRFRGLLILCPLIAGAIALAWRRSPEKPPEPPPPPKFVPLTEASPLGPEKDFEGEPQIDAIREGDSLSSAASRVAMSRAEVDEVVRALKGVYDFRSARPGHRFDLVRDLTGRLTWFRYMAGPRAIYHAWRDLDGTLKGLSEQVIILTQAVFVTGEIDQSLYVAMEAAGEYPWLTMLLVDLFAWDIDFYTETQKGDRFKLIVEKEFVAGEFIGYGRILGAEYAMANGRTNRAFFYLSPDGKTSGYYSPEGTSVRKAFLKSPIQFASITSKFGLRMHPILQYVRAHKGVDYGAPQGTAIWAVADGVVSHSSWSGGYGNLVAIRHSNGFESRYAHLSRFGQNVRAGRRVSQKQIIGYVGKTGLATGAHLHFEVLQHGKFVNPLRIAVPPSPPIPSAEMATFRETIAPVLGALESGTAVLALEARAK
jgi:murein DD-endopeptidase MepM/ murein hydrolase activator NlpD